MQNSVEGGKSSVPWREWGNFAKRRWSNISYTGINDQRKSCWTNEYSASTVSANDEQSKVHNRSRGGGTVSVHWHRIWSVA